MSNPQQLWTFLLVRDSVSDSFPVMNMYSNISY